MKIYFCDICNESIPLTDLKDSRASTIKGKIFCGKCNPLNTVPETKKATTGGLLVPVVLFAVAGGVAGAAWFQNVKLGQRVDQLPQHDTQIASLQSRLDDTLDRLDDIRDGQDLERSQSSQLREEQAATRQALADQGSRIDRSEKSLQELRSLLENLRSDREMIQKLELGHGELEHSLREVRESMASLEGRLSGMVAMSTPVDGSEEGGDEERLPAEFDSDTIRLIEDLDSRDASVRWSAVDRLAEQRNPSLIPHLVPLLEDADAFVQFRVISTLRELNARSAVGKLIDLLRDGDAIVREEALEALVALTGNPTRFDVTNGSSSEREKGVRVWEQWFKENRERFEGGGPGSP